MKVQVLQFKYTSELIAKKYWGVSWKVGVCEHALHLLSALAKFKQVKYNNFVEKKMPVQMSNNPIH